MSVRILTGDSREVLKTLADESVHCVVTSPPYWNLRDYGVDGQIGLEPSLKDYIAELVLIGTEIWRVLRPDGTLWLNLGDTYATNTGVGGGKQGAGERSTRRFTSETKGGVRVPAGSKAKDLLGIPWQVALSYQKWGWWLRQDIIWSKPNPMPESVTDRCTRAHEYIFLLSKSSRYYFDASAIAEASSENSHGGLAPNVGRRAAITGNHSGPLGIVTEKRNKRDVWEIAAQPFSEAHFATFPPALIEPCILAGCPEGGTVLDPFFGAGTTGLVCDRLNRNCIGIELNPEYAEMARKRIEGDAPLFAEVAA